MKLRRSHWGAITSLISGGAILLAAGPSVAQQPQRQTSAQTLLEEVVVTARRREESLQDLPLSIAAFNADQMQAQGIQSIEQVGDFVPNVTLTTSDRANNTRVVIRGIGGGGPDPVDVFGAGMYIDGHYIPNSLGGYMSTMDIERVEVLRGPQGTLFGKNVTGGAVNIISAKPGPDFDSSITMQVADGGERNVRGMVNFPVSDTVFVRAGLASEQFEGYYYNRHLDRMVDGKDGTTFNGAIRWQPNDNWTVDLNTFLIRRRDGNNGIQCSDLGGPLGNAPNWGGEYPNGRVNRVFNSDVNGNNSDVAYHLACNGDAADSPYTNSQEKITWSNIDQQSLFASAQWDSGGPVGGMDNMQIKMNASYRKNEYNYVQDRDASYLSIDAIGTFNGHGIGQNNWTRGAEFVLEAQANDRLKFTVGLNYFGETAKNGDGECRNEWVSDPDNTAVLLDPNTQLPILDANGQLQAAFPGRSLNCDSVSGLFFELLPNPRVAGGELSFMNTEYVHNESTGLFGHLTYALTDNWDLDFGARYNKDDREFWNMEFGGDAFCDNGVRAPGDQVLGDPSTTGSTDLCRGISLTATWDNTVGGGLFNNAKDSWTKTTPMLSFTRNLQGGDRLESGMFYFLYSQGYLTGGFNVELNANLPTARALQSYDPETVDNYEVGFKGTFADGRVRFSGDVFMMDYKNKQAGVSIPNPDGAFGIDDPLGINLNVAKVKISGLEAELRASLWDGGFLSVDAGTLSQEYDSYTFPNPVPGNSNACDPGVMTDNGATCDRTDVTIANLTPDWTLNVGIEHTFNLAGGGTLTPRLNVYSQDKLEYSQHLKSLPDTPCTQDQYSKVGARLTYEPPSGNWRGAIYGNNLTDEVIFSSCGDSRGIWRYRYERPKWMGIEFSASFGNN